MNIRQSKVNIRDVALAAGVSKATAAAALNKQTESRVAIATRQRIHEVAERLGYERSALAVALSVGRTYTIGLVSQVDEYEKDADIDVYQKDLILAVMRACARADLRLTTILVRAEGTVSASEITDGRIDGAIVALLRDETLARSIFARGFPTITIGSGYSECRVGPDNRGGLRSAVEHLAERGHRRIVYVGTPGAETWTSLERFAGYEETMRARGLKPRRIINTELDDLFSEPLTDPPTACVCFNDRIASHVLRWARARKIRIPQDLSVVGFDDGVIAQTADPRLTTVANPLNQQAEAAVSLLQSLWRGEIAIPPPPLTTQLITRDSTAVCPSASPEIGTKI